MYYIKNATLPTNNDYNEYQIKNMRLYMATIIIQQQKNFRRKSGRRTQNNQKLFILQQQQELDYYNSLKFEHTKDNKELTKYTYYSTK